MEVGDPLAEVFLLGPLEVRVDGRQVSIVRPKQRALLAVLALDAGSCVSVERLTDEVWGAAPPGSVRHSLQVHVSELRKLLGPSLIETCPGGYRLKVPREAVDALRAEALLADGAAAEAVALFRGRPLQDVELEGHDASRLEDLHADALEQSFEAQLAEGAGAALIAPLERLVTAFPLRERPRAQLMLALYRAGRQADALAVFQDARRTFVEALGIDPSPALRELERQILQQDDVLDAAEASPAVPDAASPRATGRRAAAAVAFALVATSAGLAAAYVIPPGHSHAAAALTRTARRQTRPSSYIAVPVTTTHMPTQTRKHATTKAVVRPPAPAPAAKTVKTASTSARTATTTAPVTPPPIPPPTTTHAQPPPQHTTPRITTTTPIRTTPPPVTTTAPSADPVTIADTFDNGVVNQAVWNVLINGIGADAVQRNGKLVISIAANAKPGGSYNFVGVQYGTKQCFTGDLDMRVDFRLVQWPASSGAYVSLNAVFANAMVERFSSPYGGSDVYGSMIDPRFVSQDASGSSGTLRLRRVGGIVTTYYLDNSVWQQIDSAPAGGAAHLHIGLSMNPGISPASPVSVELDNFSATAAGPIVGC